MITDGPIHAKKEKWPIVLAFSYLRFTIYLDGGSNENVAVNFCLCFLAGIVAQTYAIIFICRPREKRHNSLPARLSLRRKPEGELMLPVPTSRERIVQETEKSLVTSGHDRLESTSLKESTNESMQPPEYREKSLDEQLRKRNDLA